MKIFRIPHNKAIHIIYAFEAETGALLWKYQTEEGDWNEFYSDSDPIVIDDTTHISSEYGYLYAIDNHTGELKWKYPGAELFTVQAGILYAKGNDTLYAFDLAKIKQLLREGKQWW